MSDLTERAKVVLHTGNTEQYRAVMGHLIAELEAIEPDFGQLRAVATMYVDAFKEDEMMSLPEKMRLQEVEEILKRHGRAY